MKCCVKARDQRPLTIKQKGYPFTVPNRCLYDINSAMTGNPLSLFKRDTDQFDMCCNTLCLIASGERATSHNHAVNPHAVFEVHTVNIGLCVIRGRVTFIRKCLR